MDREHERFRENLAKSFKNDLFNDSFVVKGEAVSRYIDFEQVNKCRLSAYGQISGDIKHMINHSDEYADMEKARDKSVDSAKLEDRLDPRVWGLEQQIEKIYYDTYGHSYNLDPVTGDYGLTCPAQGEPWICPNCKTKHAMSLKLMRTHCMKCGHISPIGELKRDGVHKRL